MHDIILRFLQSFGLSPKITILLLSTLPVTELRASVPIGILILKESMGTAFFYSVIGNMLPVIPIYFLLDPVSKRLSRTELMRKFFEWLFSRAKKRAGIVEKYEAIGLMFFVGIPFPGTGIWTGCLIASILRMRFLPTFFACLAGVLIAAVIVTALTMFGQTAFQ